ncbi:cytochrome P450 [Cladochytrium replicatum]|nr:cytochrome P450 [Cladochytrium replicatum]
MVESFVKVLATIAASIISIVVVALVFDPTKPKRRGSNGKPLNLPPSVAWTFILPRIANIRQLFVDIKRRYGDLVYIHFPFRGSLLVATGNQTTQWFFKELKELYHITEPWEPRFPERFQSTTWTKIITRALNQEFFYETIHSSLNTILKDRVADWAAKCESGETFDVFEEAHSVVLDVNTKVMFGTDWNDKDLEDFKKAFAITDPATWWGEPLNILFPSRGAEVRKKWNEVLLDTSIRHAQKHLDQGINPNESTLDFFLSVYPNPETGAYLSWSLELASFVTTGSAASWLLYHLGVDEKLRDRVRMELEQVIPAGQGLSIEHLPKLRFIDSLVRELLRAHTQGLSVRKAPDGLKYGDIDIPKDTMIMFTHSSIHHDKETYADPFAFKPDRFLNENGEFNGGDYMRDGTFLGFGAGRHPCLGMKLATNELKVLTYELLTKYDLKLTNEAVFPPLTGLGFETPKNSVRFVVSRRE